VTQKADLSPLLKIQRTQDRMGILIGLAFAAIGAFLVFIPAEEDSDLVIKIVMAAAFGIAGGAFLLFSLRSPAKAPLLRALLETPERVAWIYVQRGMRGGRAISSVLKVGLVSGKMLELSIGVGKDDEMQALAASHAPAAKVGWSSKLEMDFNLDPPSLRRPG